MRTHDRSDDNDDPIDYYFVQLHKQNISGFPVLKGYDHKDAIQEVAQQCGGNRVIQIKKNWSYQSPVPEKPS